MDAEVRDRFDAVLGQLHDLRALVSRLAVPVEVRHAADAAAFLGVGLRTVQLLTAAGVFTDGRAPGRRVKGSPRLYYADELTVYRSEGRAGVRRLREELGRLAPGEGRSHGNGDGGAGGRVSRRAGRRGAVAGGPAADAAGG